RDREGVHRAAREAARARVSMKAMLAAIAVAACTRDVPPDPDIKLPLVPPPIAAQLGAVDVVGALRIGAAWRENLASRIPDVFACGRDLVRSLDLVAFGLDSTTMAWRVLATGVSQTAIRNCLDQIGPTFNIKPAAMPHGFEIKIDEGPITFE